MRRGLAAIFIATLVPGLITLGPNAGAERTPRRLTGSITVFAASSLTEAFTEIGRDFERSHPGTTIAFSFNSSSALATQIDQGAPADVFAAADAVSMARAVDAGAIRGTPTAFARNRLEIAVEPGNPSRIRSLADTVRGNITLVLCSPAVPCGRYARRSYAKAGVRVPEVPTAESAKAALTRVALGEADAALVYVTDVAAASDDVDGVAIPDRVNVVATYTIGVATESENPALARAFTAAVASPLGRSTLRRFSFLAP